MKQRANFLIKWLLICFLIPFSLNIRADDIGSQETKIKLSKSKESIYKLLNIVSEQSGFLFIYDSRLIDNDQVVKIPSGEYTLPEAIRIITGNYQLSIRTVGNHVLLYIPVKEEDTLSLTEKTEEERYFTIEGVLCDHLTGEPVIYGTISVSNSSLGTVSNQNGEFKLSLPDSLKQSTVKFSHLGYTTREIDVSLLAGQHIVFHLDQKVIPLQEVVVRVVDPTRTIREMMARRHQNYPDSSVYLTTFYREGIEYKNNVKLIEAVLKIFKTGYQNGVNSEQVKLLKMRRVNNEQAKDTLVTRIKSSVNSCLLLDLVKNPPDFLLSENLSQYNYSLKDITTIDDRRVYVFSFEQREPITDPFFTGELCIDAENFALIQARFEINPKYVSKAADMLIIRKSRHLEITPQKVVYLVSYKPVNGRYNINHIRGDLNFKVRKKGRLFSSNLNVWFEMANCKTDTLEVVKFHNYERIATRDIFSETNFTYDQNFWGNFNVILPEEKLQEIIQKYNFNQKK